MSTQQQDHRSDRPDDSTQRAGAETGTTSVRIKRIAAAAIGAVLVVRGLSRRSVGGAVMALLGVGLVARTLIGGGGGDGSVGRSRSTEQIGEVGVSRSVTISEPADELYEAWRDPEVFSHVVGGFAEIKQIDEDRYHWTVSGPGGTELSWETRVIEAEPGEVVRWKTPDDASVPNRGSVRFRRAPGDRGTVLTLSLEFDPPGGRIGAEVINRLDIVPETLAGQMLGRFKSLTESGETPSLAGNPSGRGQGDLL